MKITIPGEPIPKVRPRFFTKGNHQLAYNPQAVLESEIKIRLKQGFKKCEINKTDSDIGYELHFRFYFRPHHSPKLQCNAKMWGLMPHSQKPDVDNLLKFYMDCANKILYNDDAQVIRISASKHWSKTPRTEILLVSHKTPVLSESVKTFIKLFSDEEVKEFYENIKDLGRNVSEISQLDNEQVRLMIIEKTSYDMTLFALKFGDKLSKLSKESIKDKNACF